MSEQGRRVFQRYSVCWNWSGYIWRWRLPRVPTNIFRVYSSDHSLGNKAAGFLSIKRNMSSYKNDPSSKFGIKPPDEPSPFSICLRQNSSGKSQYSLDVELPTLKLSMSKIIFDHLAYWADDISRRLFSPEPASPSEMSGRSRDVSMIGSRYFAKGSVATNSSDVVEVERKSEFATRIFVEKGKIYSLPYLSRILIHQFQCMSTCWCLRKSLRGEGISSFLMPSTQTF